MECRKFEITIISADDLPDVRNFLQMKVFAKVSIQGQSKTTKKTPADMEGEKNPVWNFSTEYTIGEAAVQQEGTPKGRLSISYRFGERIFVKKPSGWNKALEFGFLILVGGALLLLDGADDSQIPVFTDSKDAVVVDDGDVFYDFPDSDGGIR
ncbi:unnamed protein product [Fraxinus pennsylvanica]|uniref:C2 domain-containing protein n=1 Tax=Fraxinus pennsylvanica TaxID=56036 RepID=A0AAD1Z6G1_9LAMI|nr:unnamed protein product [Fraxinus pennsylvanica]